MGRRRQRPAGDQGQPGTLGRCTVRSSLRRLFHSRTQQRDRIGQFDDPVQKTAPCAISQIQFLADSQFPNEIAANTAAPYA